MPSRGKVVSRRPRHAVRVGREVIFIQAHEKKKAGFRANDAEQLEIIAHEPELGRLVILAQGFVACFHFFPSCSRHIMGPFVYPETLFSTNIRSHYFRSLLFAYFCTFNRRLARPLVIDYFSSRKSYLIISSNKVRYLCFDFYYTESSPIFVFLALPSCGRPSFFFFPCAFRYHFNPNNAWVGR